MSSRGQSSAVGADDCVGLRSLDATRVTKVDAGHGSPCAG